MNTDYAFEEHVLPGSASRVGDIRAADLEGNIVVVELTTRRSSRCLPTALSSLILRCVVAALWWAVGLVALATVSTLAAAVKAAFGLSSVPQELYCRRFYLRGVALVSIAVLPLASLNTPLHVYLASLSQVLPTDFT